MQAAAIIVAGGLGLRAGGDVPKQLQQLGPRRVFEWSLAAFASHPDVSQIVLVVPQGDTTRYHNPGVANLRVVCGGATRTQSVRCGLAALDLSDDDVVLVHDAARPGLTGEMISRLLAGLEGAEASAPALPVTDALKRRGNDTLRDLDRTGVFRVQTPQTFRFASLVAALGDPDAVFVDDLHAIEAYGGRVNLIEGSERLNKITLPGDLELMARLLSAPVIPRVGTGFDVHAFGQGDHVTLCGTYIPFSQGLAGHSDADVAWHALTDAILGAAALGDIGDHFPPSDPRWKGANSEIFLRHAADLAREAGFEVRSCDITVICEAPKVKPLREQMRMSTAHVLGLDPGSVSVKATTTEGLGFAGRREGIAAQAVAVLSPIDVSA